MAYRIEFSQPLGLPFNVEFLLVDQATGLPVPIGDDQLEFRVGWGSWGCCPSVVACAANGMLATTEPGLISVSIPFDRWGFGWHFHDDYGLRPPLTRTLPFRLLTIPYDPAFTSLLATGAISFGDSL